MNVKGGGLIVTSDVFLLVSWNNKFKSQNPAGSTAEVWVEIRIRDLSACNNVDMDTLAILSL
jgi:hypothetical protein